MPEGCLVSRLKTMSLLQKRDTSRFDSKGCSDAELKPEGVPHSPAFLMSGMQEQAHAATGHAADRSAVVPLNQPTRDSYTHAASLACASSAMCSTAAVTSGA